jgi:glycosyltransferase involved in cell wall biosynthesis
VGRFVPLKGFDLCIRSFAQFYHELNPLQKDGVRLTIVGKGPQKKYLQELAVILNVSRQVRFLDWVDKNKLDEIYRRTDLLLFPSHEGAGMVIPEAFVYGIPVVCLDNTGPGESIDRDSGIKVPYQSYEKTVEGLAQAILRISSDPKFKTQLSLGARRRFESWFDWEVKGKMVHEMYNSLLEKKEGIKEPA